jgi:monoamine oxidase
MRRRGRDRSVAEFLDAARVMPRQQKQIVTSIVEGYDAAPLETASERVLAMTGESSSAPEDHAQFRVASGYGAVARYLWRRIERRRLQAHFRSAVRAVQWSRRRVTVLTQSGLFRTRRAIFTVPVGVLKAPSGVRGAIRFDPEPVSARRALDRLEMGHAIKMVLRFRERFWRRSDAFERLLTADSREPAFFHSRHADFPTWWTAAPAEVPIITGWAGGPAALALEAQSQSAVLKRALTTLESFFEISRRRIEGLLVDHYRHDWTQDPFCRGAYSYVAVGGAAAPAALARPVQDTLFFAGEATDLHESGTVPGAIASGRRAARLITG